MLQVLFLSREDVEEDVWHASALCALYLASLLHLATALSGRADGPGSTDIAEL